MRDAIRAVTYAGAAGQTSGRVRAVLIGNVSALSAFTVTALYQSFYLLQDRVAYAPVLYVNLVAMILFLMVPWFNHRKHHLAAGNLLFATVCAQFVFVDYLVRIDVHLFYFVLIGVLPLLYERSGLAVLASMTASVLALFLLVHFAFPPQAVLTPFSQAIRDGMYAGNVIGTGSMLLLVAWLIRLEIADAESTLAKTNRMLERLSITDELTRLLNRRGLRQALELQCAAMRRNRRPLSLLMCDIDFFKHYNDRYGHPAGDDVLRRVAAALADVARQSSDQIARFGGEEFVVLLPDTDEIAAGRIAERIRASIQALAIDHPDSAAAPVVTVSIGLATGRHDRRASERALLHAADDALYDAKKAGCNRVAVAPPIDASSRDRPADHRSSPSA